MLTVWGSVSASAQVAADEGWRTTESYDFPRLRLTSEILDSQPAVLELEVAGTAVPYGYSVNWGDGSPPEVGRRHSKGTLRLTHDYDLISTFRVIAEISVGGEKVTIDAGLVAVADDDTQVPEIEWTLPETVLRPGEPAIVAWKITDASGLDRVTIDIEGPEEHIGHFKEPEGRVDLSGLGLGSFGIQVVADDADDDRPGDSSGFLLSESIVITDDLDGDEILDYLDNCPRDANEDQSDLDNDGLGDVCDPCPRINGLCPEEPAADDGAAGGGGPAGPAPWLVFVPLLIFAASRRFRLAVSLAVLAGLIAAAASAAPVISNVRPAVTLVGEPVIILGTGFGSSQGATGRVTFGGVDAGTVYHWTDERITVEVPVGFLTGTVPTPTPTGSQQVRVRTNAGDESAAVSIEIARFEKLPAFRSACRCGDPGCVGPCLPDDYCRRDAGGCTFDGRTFGWRDIKDVDFGDVDDDGDLDVVDVSSPNCATCGAAVRPGIPFYCASPVNFPDRLFLNDGTGRYSDFTGGPDRNYETEADNPIPHFHSYRTYDADLIDIDNDGYLDYVRADRNFCSGERTHYWKNIDTSGDGRPDTKFRGFAIGVAHDEAYWDNLATGDLEGDGDLDLLISHSDDSRSIHALQFNTGGSFASYDPATMAPTHSADDDFTAYQRSAHDMALIDLDGDRDQDIIIGGGNHTRSRPNSVLLNRFAETGELYFERIPIPSGAAATSRTIHVGTPDLNGDGRPDVHFVNYSPADQLLMNLGKVDCGAAEATCGDTLSCSSEGLGAGDHRICWGYATPEMPEQKSGVSHQGYSADYGDIDADGDLDILVTGIQSSGNYLYLNRAGTNCSAAGDCPSGYGCTAGKCRPSSASATPKWWACPPLGSGSTRVACNDRDGSAITGTEFPAAQQGRRSLAVVFGDVDGDVDVDILWARGQWGSEPWAAWPDAGPMILIGDGERPYVKRATVFSGARIVYQAQWAPNAAGTHLVLAPSTFAAAAPFTALRTQDVHIEIEFNEPMASANLVSITPSIGVMPTFSSSQPEGGKTIWRATISNLDIADDGSEDRTYSITIDGEDTVGNDLLRISGRSNIALTSLRGGTAGRDTIHGFRVGPLAGEIPVRALFMKQNADVALGTPAIADKALALQTALTNYYRDVSYGEITFAVSGHGWYRLDHPLSWYETDPRTPLVDLVQEAVGDARADGVDLSGGYVLVVTDETSAREEWSTTGGWPYTVSGAPQLLASGTLNLNSSNARITHLAGRWVGLIDLFPHPEVTFSRPFVGPYSHMSDKDTEVHVLGWEKWRAGWIDQTGTATNKRLTRVAKPSPASPISGQTHTILPLDSADDGIKMVAIEIGDSLHFTAEYRRQQNRDAALPEDGVLVTKTNDRVAQGEGPAIVMESVVSTDLSTAPFEATNRFTDAGSGVDLRVTSITPGQAQIRLDYAVPATQNDVWVDPHDDRWKSDDIWVDAPNTALEFAPDPRSVRTADEKPVVGYVNKVIGRVRNRGRADATNFEVELEILDPWGSGGSWRSLKVEQVILLQGQDNDANADFLVIANWTPATDRHACVRLRVRGVANDVDETNNGTQENIHDFVSTPGSPYSPITSRFQVENPYAETVPILFRVDGLPAGWSHTLTPQRPVLAPGATTTAQITLQPADGAPLCSREEVTVNAYAPRVDTLKRLGGVTLGVELKNRATVTTETRLNCKGGEGAVASPAIVRTSGCAISTRGCTDPGLPNTELALIYTAPDGSVSVRYVITDENGCFNDLVPGTVPGLWQVETVLEEEDCRQGDRTPQAEIFVPPPIGFGDGDGNRYFGVFTGGGWPLSDLDDFSASFMFAAQVEWERGQNLRLGLQLGYHAFDAEPAAGVDNLGFTNLSVIARWLGATSTLRPFLLAGVGAYESDGNWDPGIQAGFGFEVPLTSSASLAAGMTAHSVDRSTMQGTRPTWADAYLGFFVRWP